MYKSENFAQVINTQHVENLEALKKRKAYVEYQMSEGFLNTLIIYQKENQLGNWKDMVTQCQKLIELTQEIYKKNQNNGQVIFQLEQVLGRVESLFEERENITQELNSQGYLDYQNNLHQLKSLSEQLAGHKSIIMKNLGIALIVIGLIATVAVLLTSVFALGGAFITGSALAVTGLIVMGGGLLALFGQQQKGLSLAVSTLANTATNVKVNEIESPVEYFDNFVSPRLYKEDALELRKNLVLQLNEGFDPIILKNVLRWATRADYISKGGYEDFFECMNDICCKSSSYWIKHERIHNRYWPDCSGQISDQSWIPIYSKNNFFAKTTCSAISTLKLFDELTTGQINSDDQTIMRKGLQHLINNNTPPFLIKNAFIWAKTRYDETQSPLTTTCLAQKGKFFERIAVICGVVLAPKVLAAPVFNPEGVEPQLLETVPIRDLPVFEF
jgi:hypothetical protein